MVRAGDGRDKRPFSARRTGGAEVGVGARKEMQLPQPRGEGNILRVLSRESDLPSFALGQFFNFEVKIIPENAYILTTPGFLSDIQVIIQARYPPHMVLMLEA